MERVENKSRKDVLQKKGPRKKVLWKKSPRMKGPLEKNFADKTL